MKTHIFRLGSVGAHMVGGPEAGAIDLIYSSLLQEFGQDIYSHIHVNQIGQDLDELVMKEGKKIHINIRYPAYEDFEVKSVEEKNRIRLEVAHAGLLRIAEYDKKLDINKLEIIRKKILGNNFLFDFVYKTYVNKKNPNLSGKVIVQPLMDKFVFYALIEEDNKVKCKQIFFRGIPGYYYMDKYFCYGKWDKENELIIWGKEKIVETHVNIESCSVNIVNLTPYPTPPYYTLMRVDISDEEREKSRKDWEHSQPPAITALVRQSLGGAAN